jgi:aminodeoxyfutalosine deaminase
VDVGDVDSLYACEDFASFLRAFLRVVRVLQTPQDFADLAGEYIEQAAAQNVRHVEVFLSPATQRKFVPGLDPVQMIQAVNDACTAAASRTGMTFGLLIDMVRNLGESEALIDVALAQRCAGLGVIGIGLGGDERNFPARDFASAFALAKESGLRRTVHAGEAAGSESILDAVRLLDAERIGHGVAARGNPEVLALLRERAISIDACPTSNRFTGAVAADETHPLREFLNAGVTVTLNSDDPAFFKASIADEYANAASDGFGAIEIAAIARNGFAASFRPETDRRRLSAEVDAYCVEFGMTR